MDEHFNIRLHEVPDENFSSRKHYAIQIRYPVTESFLQEWDLRKKELAAGIISKSEYTEWKRLILNRDIFLQTGLDKGD